MNKRLLTAGALFAASAVMLGAFGAHALKVRLTAEMLQVFETGVRYQFYHSIALLICGMLYASFPVKQMKIAGSLFIAGIALFSGSLYAISLMSISGGSIGPAGVLTPIGGLLFIMGWLFVVLGVAGKH
jgi:uncharacterized membrane protein YgdD (TMEM256/DUF423 family)